MTSSHRLVDNTYAELFDTAAQPFGDEQAVRLARYTLTNPAPTPVAVSIPSLSAITWSIGETWTIRSGGSLGTETCITRVAGGACEDGPRCSTTYSYGASACGRSTLPPTSPSCGTAAPTTGPTSYPAASGGVNAIAYGQNLGADTYRAPVTNTGAFIIPAAVGTTPGTLTLYIVRPLQAFTRPATSQLTWDVGLRAYDNAYRTVWRRESSSGTVCCSYSGTRCADSRTSTTIWSGTSYRTSLTAAVEDLSGAFQLETAGVEGTTSFGETNTAASPTLTITRRITH
jgi:hypothetical protein